MTCCFNKMCRLRIFTTKLGAPVSTVPKEIDWQGRAYNLAVLLCRYNSPLIRRGREYIKDPVYIPPLATILPVTPDLLSKVWWIV
jgi:hypothetical protein